MGELGQASERGAAHRLDCASTPGADISGSAGDDNASESADGGDGSAPAGDGGAAEPAEDGGLPASRGDDGREAQDAASRGRPVGGPPDQPPVEWSDLPATVRTAAIALAAGALGVVPADQVPPALAPIARFTSARRARLGAGPLARALEQDAGFRALVAQYLPVERAAPVHGSRAVPSGQRAAGTSRAAADSARAGQSARAAARAFLVRSPDARAAVAAAERLDEALVLRAQVDELTGAVDQLTRQLAAVTAARSSPDRGGRPAGGDPDPRGDRGPGSGVRREPAPVARQAEADRLRRRLREQGARVKAAEGQAQEAAAQARREVARAEAQLVRERANAEHWRARAEQETHRADRALQALDRFRDDASQQRADVDRRLELLLETVERAAAGLRHEWRLATGGADPADVLQRALPAVGGNGHRSADAPLLLGWLGQPNAHLIVDGYNVTKTGYPELSLSDQRDRLVRALGALAARTDADVTVVFDGAAVVAPAPVIRGVRVIFSPPDVIADAVIRRLAAVEPAGRVVVVVSSDREVVDGVRRSGAHTAPSPVLLAALG